MKNLNLISGLLMTLFVPALAYGVTWGPLVLKPDGLVLQTSVRDAQRYCLKNHLRLPTARELAQLAVSQGAKFSDTPQAGLYEIEALNIDLTSDTFYYSETGFRGGTTGDALWSSSKVTADKNLNYLLATTGGNFALAPNNGTFVFAFAFRCVQD